MSTVIVPAGTYYLCDPCYVIPDAEWSDILDLTDMYEQEYNDPERGVTMAFGTAYGDGTYFDQTGKAYDVDAGLIGLTDVRYNSNPDQEYKVVTFSEPTECSTDGETLRFGPFVIETGD